MTIINVDFANERRDRERRLIVLADWVYLGLSSHDLSSDGPLTAADLLEMESECWDESWEDENQEDNIFVRYCCAVGGVVASDKIDAGLGNPQIVDFDAYLDSRNHARALAWAREYLESVSTSFGVRLEVTR